MSFLWLFERISQNSFSIHRKQQYNMMISSVVPPLDGAPAPANSSSAAASAVAAVKSSAKSNKQRMNLFVPPEHQKMFDAVRSELLLVYCTPGEVRAWITYMYVLISIYIYFGLYLCLIRRISLGPILFCEVLFSSQFWREKTQFVSRV